MIHHSPSENDGNSGPWPPNPIAVTERKNKIGWLVGGSWFMVIVWRHENLIIFILAIRWHFIHRVVDGGRKGFPGDITGYLE